MVPIWFRAGQTRLLLDHRCRKESAGVDRGRNIAVAKGGCGQVHRTRPRPGLWQHLGFPGVCRRQTLRPRRTAIGVLQFAGTGMNNPRRKGFAWGLFAGVLFVAYKAVKYPGSLGRANWPVCLAVVLSFG